MIQTVCDLDLKWRSYGHLKEPQISHLAQVNSALCEIRTTHFPYAKFTPPFPCANFWASSSLPSPIPSLWASFLCSLMAKTRGGSTSAPQSRPLLSLLQSIVTCSLLSILWPLLRQPLWSGWTTSSFGRTNKLSFSVRFEQHLGLLPPAPPVAPVPSEPSALADDFAPTDDATPVAVPSTVAVEDPSYPPEETTTWSYDHSSPFLYLDSMFLDVIYILDHFCTGIGCIPCLSCILYSLSLYRHLPFCVF